MILQSLVHLYDELSRQGKVAREGWGIAKVSHRLVLDEEGGLIGIVSARKKVLRGKKEKEIPSDMMVPLPATRSSGVKANFLCDNSSYFLGVDNKGKPERTKECFEAARALHHQILDGCHSAEARAILSYFDHWDVAGARDNPLVQTNLEDILGGSNFLFHVGNKDVSDIPEIRDAWERYYRSGSGEEDTIKGQCLITGKKDMPIATLHPKIKGVLGAQSSGANLVSFNAPAFCSYGYDGEQGQNAPVSEEAANAYGAALNFLLADRTHAKVMGDTTVVYWSEHGEEAYQDGFLGMMGDEGGLTDEELDDVLAHMKEGRSSDIGGISVSPDEPFYILGLAPNAARISVRFFLRNTFGDILKNLAAHEERMKIVHSSLEKERIPLYWILKAMDNPDCRKESAPSTFWAGKLTNAILINGYYPEAVYKNIMRRVFLCHEKSSGGGKNKEKKIDYIKASFIKAYLLKNCGMKWEGKIQMAVNENCNDISYVLGRLFSVLENIQKSANHGINSTIKDRYFNSACATPAAVFPLLWKLTNAHLGKLDQPKAAYFKKKLGMLMDKIAMPDTGTPLPHRLTLDEQGAFVLGYYQETQARYAGKKEEK
ncbi:type I-C CRISPR-associated protein Cas8c/Csd1 [uncultured Dialister sp.]|uniref:type I-C CRISPR-associated protein Cas8c/Csd1 n=1 Tax=uncultured Dialister sp. TaxID=278064 RepID=UPI0025EEBCB8|nr:type I-C CRISPR-associated protein Cas8c/Csd1 [uncultured Dialister sp.]